MKTWHEYTIHPWKLLQHKVFTSHRNNGYKMTSEKSWNKHNWVLGGKIILYLTYYWTLYLDCTDIKNMSVILFLWYLVQNESVSLVVLEKRREPSTPKALVNHIVRKRIPHWNFAVKHSPALLCVAFPIKLCSKILSFKQLEPVLQFHRCHQHLFLYWVAFLYPLPSHLTIIAQLRNLEV